MKKNYQRMNILLEEIFKIVNILGTDLQNKIMM